MKSFDINYQDLIEKGACKEVVSRFIKLFGFDNVNISKVLEESSEDEKAWLKNNYDINETIYQAGDVFTLDDNESYKAMVIHIGGNNISIIDPERLLKGWNGAKVVQVDSIHSITSEELAQIHPL